MENQYRITFELNVVNLKKSMIARKRGSSIFTSQLSKEKLLEQKNEVAQIIGANLIEEGTVFFGDIDIIKIVEKKKK